MIRADALSFSYGGPPLFERVSFRVAEGEALAILGPNGSGKTTLLKLLAGLLEPVAGTIEVGGCLLSGIDPAERAMRLAYVPQGVDPTVPFTVFETVLMGRYAHLRGRWERDVDREVTRRAIATMGLEGVAERPIARLSGGERQRTMIAAALAQEAPVLLLDEPTTALDMRARSETLELLDRLRAAERRTLVVVTHDIDLEARSCGRLLLLGAPGGPVEGPRSEVLVPERLEAAYGVGVRTVEVPGEPVPVYLPVTRRGARPAGGGSA